jgi:hypothetical protein
VSDKRAGESLSGAENAEWAEREHERAQEVKEQEDELRQYLESTKQRQEFIDEQAAEVLQQYEETEARAENEGIISDALDEFKKAEELKNEYEDWERTQKQEESHEEELRQRLENLRPTGRSLGGASDKSGD